MARRLGRPRSDYLSRLFRPNGRPSKTSMTTPMASSRGGAGLARRSEAGLASPDFDDSVRQALDPDARTVDRMVSSALERGKRVSRRHGAAWRLAFAAATVLVCALWVLRQPLLGPSGPAPLPAVGFALTRAGDVVMIQSASGETLILGPRTAGDSRPAGTGFVIVEEDSK